MVKFLGKTEFRTPKSERNPKSETKPARQELELMGLELQMSNCYLLFGIRPSEFFRVSDFELRI